MWHVAGVGFIKGRPLQCGFGRETRKFCFEFCCRFLGGIFPPIFRASWPRIARYRETISAIPPYCALWSFWCLNMANWVRYPLPLFLSVSPLESMQSGGAIPPPQKGYLSDTCAIPYENKANGCDTPLCDTISKGYCAIWGGISHWAAKFSVLSPWFGEPVACTLDSRGFRHFRGFRDFRYSSTQTLVCSCLGQAKNQ